MSGASPSSSIFSGVGPRIYTIDAGRPFLNELAEGVAAAIDGVGGAADGSLLLSRTEIFLPTRRAARGLQGAILDAARRRGQRATLAPRIRTLGDPDEDDIQFAGAPEDDMEFPPAISETERLLALARLIAARDRAFSGHENWAAAVGAARELARLLDAFYTEEISFDGLADAVPPEHAAHWARSVDFLQIVTAAWPAYLAASGRSDPAARRSALIGALARRWADAPPGHPVIFAGSTATAPAVARLAAAVARAPLGLVVLPGFDASLAADVRAFAAIDDPHPQARLKAFLSVLGVTARDVRRWPAGPATASPRAGLLSLALRPANATDDWRDLVAAATKADPALRAATDGLQFVEASTEEAEASAVAILLRETLEDPDARAIFVTPDRRLARRVALKMRRWGVDIDDSGGAPFGQTPVGSFLRLVADWLDDPGDPVQLLALARHELCGLRLEARARAATLDALDTCLRGVRPLPRSGERASPFERWRALVEKVHAHNRGGAAERAEAALDAFERALTSDDPAVDAPAPDNFQKRLNRHLRCAEALAAEASQARDPSSGAQRLWRGADGAAGARFLAELVAIDAPLPALASARYGEAFAALIAALIVRAHAPYGARAAILGPLEARLQSADHIILGGLNEGVWPSLETGDPFLSRPMRARLGLPSPERRIGLAAHDFYMLAAAPRVTLTRASRSEGQPGKPSRWIVRLRNIVAGAAAREGADEPLSSALDVSEQLAGYAARLDAPAGTTRITRPGPRPPLAHRPTALYVTRIEKLLRDPYAVWARDILKLYKLDQPGRGVDAGVMGAFLHEILAEASRDGPATARRMMELCENRRDAWGISPAFAALARRQFMDAFEWFEAFDAEQRLAGAPVVIEGEGAMEIKNLPHAFTLKVRADRIDRLNDGTLAIFDYKTGKAPSLKQAKTFSPQLALTAMIAEAGGLADAPAAPISVLAYLKVLGRKGGREDETRVEDGEAKAAIEEARERLHSLLMTFADENTPYLPQPRPQFTDSHGDYDILSRRREWSVVGDDDTDDAGDYS